MPPFTTDEWLGTASLEPNLPVVAGAVGTWRLTYTAGRYGVDEGGTLRIARRFCSDSGTPQFDNPEAPGYTTVTLRTDGTAQFRVCYDPKAGVRPWQKCVVIDLYDGSLAEGDRVVLVFGDRSGGSPGFRMQTFCESKHEWRVLADCFGTGQFHRLSTSPIHAVVPGEPAKLVAIGRRFGEQQERLVKAEDAWGNPVRDYEGTHQVEPLKELLDKRKQLSDLRGKLASNFKLDQALQAALGDEEKMGQLKEDIEAGATEGGDDGGS